MEQKNILAYATSIQERGDSLSLHYPEKIPEDNIKGWLERKSLCTEELFDIALKEQGITRNKFNLGIKDLSDKDLTVLSEQIKQTIWYKKVKEIFDDTKWEVIEPEIIDFAYVLRPFLYYFKKAIEKEKKYNFQMNGEEAFYIYLSDDLVRISSKTIVFDLHEQKRKWEFKGETPNKRFEYYVKKRFGNKNALLDFFEEYPVLLRLLTERLIFHIENYKEFVKAIQKSLPKFEATFSITPPYQIANITVGAGDSHEKGKTVILFELNNHKLVFKYKNLVIGERFNDFLNYLEKETGKCFYKIKRIVDENFCIEDFILNKECETEGQVRNFYQRFGEYVALAYLLYGNDFHYENLVAHGEFPVLIDVETLIQNESPVKRIDNPFIELAVKKYNSVLSSALLPFEAFGNRIEPTAEGMAKGQGIRISAFDGKKQKSPYKGLGLVNINTDEVKFDYIEYELEGAHNIPIFRGQEVKAEKYKREVVKGFDEVCNYFINNSARLLVVIKELFSDVIVRNVIKTTQKYMDMLEYGYHPKCMENYAEREKLFENLWSYEYKNKSAITYEIKDLLVNDIPIFFNNTSNCDLISSRGEIIKNYYEKAAIDCVSERIKKFDVHEYSYQKLRLELSLGIYKLQTSTFKLGHSIESNLDEIAKILCRRAKYNTNKDCVTFEDFIYKPDGTLDYGALNMEFYDGLSGIYLFVLYYSKKRHNAQIETLKLALERTLFTLPNKKRKKDFQISAYIDKYSVLYPLYHKYMVEGSSEDVTFAEKLLHDLSSEMDKNIGVDWLNGVSGLIQVLVNFYKITKKNFFLEKAKILAKSWEEKKIELCGFAHGFSGLICAAYSLYLVTGEEKYIEQVREFLKKEDQYFDGKVWPDLREGKSTISGWCHGTVGIGMTRLYLLKNGYQCEQIEKDLEYCVSNVIMSELEETGICHGNIGRYLFLKEVQNYEKLTKDMKIQIEDSLITILHNVLEKGIVVGAFDNQSTLGLMTGITGIGYGLLKSIDLNLPNILCLE